MGRSRSRDRSRRSRSRSRDRDRERRRSTRDSSRDRKPARRSRSRDRASKHYSRSRSRSRDRRDRSRSRDRYIRRSGRSRSRDRDREQRRKRSRSRDRDPPRATDSKAQGTPSASDTAGVGAPRDGAPPAAANASVPAQQAATAGNLAADEKRRRLEAFKAKLSAGGVSATPAAAGSPNGPGSQPGAASTQAAKPSGAPTGVAVFGEDAEEEDAPTQLPPTAAELIAARKARADAEEAAALERQRAKMEAHMAAMAPEQQAMPKAQEEDDEVDPLDAFMAGEVLPEVLARQEAERQAREAERLKLAEQIAAGVGPAKPSVLSDSEEEPEPDARIQIPANKVKYMVGPGGVKIQEIQRRSKARIQVHKEEEELNRAFGSGGMAGGIKQAAEAAVARAQQQQAAAAAAKAKAAKEKEKRRKEREKQRAKSEEASEPGTEGGAAEEDKEKEDEGSSSSSEDEPAPGGPPRKMATLLLYGDKKALEIAERMIMEAIDNREQKKQQREKEYAKKRDEKSRNRQLYYLRHTKDYEMLEVPVGTSKADIKKAYRKLAMVWHPDKHPENQEQAKAKFQAIQRAYDSLMSTNEDERLEALGYTSWPPATAPAPG